MTTSPLVDKLLAAGGKVRDALRFDEWRNTLSSIGSSVRDKGAAWVFGRPVLLTPQQCLDLYHFDDLANRICSAVPEEALREGFEIKAIEEVETKKETLAAQQKILKKEIERLDVAGKVQEAMIWGRTTGGAAIIILAEGGGEPEEPLDVDTITRIVGLEVVDCTALTVATRYREGDKAGEVESYFVNASTSTGSMIPTNVRLHESRLTMFRGVLTSRTEKQRNAGWDHSVLQRVVNVLAQTNGAWASVITMMGDLSQAVFKMKGLIDAIAEDKEGDVQKRISLMDMTRSVANAIVLDSEEEDYKVVERGAATGLDGLVDKLFLRLSSAARMPVAILLGQSPAGLNATGSIDLRWWYDTIKTAQTIEAKPRITHLVRMISTVLFGSKVNAEIWGVYFKSLWQMSPQEEAAYRKSIAETDNIYAQMGAVIAEEITLSRWGSGEYSAEMIIDLDSHNAMREVELSKAARLAEEDDEREKPETETKPALRLVTEAPKPAPEAAPVEEAKDPTTALNGAQVAALSAIITSVATRQYPRETGVQLILAAFPVDAAQAERILGEVGRTFFAASPDAAPTPPPDESVT